MLAKCTNLYALLRSGIVAKGHLFRLETGEADGSSKVKVTEYFWLCERCSVSMTLHLAYDGRVMPTELQGRVRHGQPQLALVMLNHENQRSLRGVRFFRKSHPRGT